MMDSQPGQENYEDKRRLMGGEEAVGSTDCKSQWSCSFLEGIQNLTALLARRLEGCGETVWGLWLSFREAAVTGAE